MAQGYTGYTILDNAITIKDSPNLDAFSRFRVSNPLTIFSNQFTYDLSPLVFSQDENNPGFSSITHNANEGLANIAVLNGGLTGTQAYMQSFEHIPYQPGRSQLVFITFCFQPLNSETIITNQASKWVGLWDNGMGVGFRYIYDSTIGNVAFEIGTTTLAGSQNVSRPFWNLDRLDGTGPSGINMDIRYTQILVIDLQALYVGRVRFGFDIDGKIIYAHEFLNANIFQSPYINTANLPICAGIIATSTIATILGHSIDFICCSVASEGGSEDSQRFGYTFSYSNSKVPLPATNTYLCSLRPTGSFGGLPPNMKIVLESIEIINTGNKAAKYQLGIGDTLTGGTYNLYNITHSGVEIDTTGTAALTPAVIFESGFVPSGGGSRTSSISSNITSKYPITLDSIGNPRDLGTVYLYAEGIGGTTDIYYNIKWKEIR